MGKKERIELLIDGGNAKPDAATSQRLGPMKINIGAVMSAVNEKTNDFKGMKVPVKITVDTETKDFEIDVGLPPTSELIKKELKIDKGSGQPDKEKIANISVEHLIKIAKMKKEGMFVNNLNAAVKTIAGSCNSIGILIEGKTSAEFNKDLESGTYDTALQEEKTEPSPEKLKQLQQQLTEVQEAIKKEQEKLKASKQAEKKEEEKAEEKKEEPKKDEKKDAKKK